MKGNHCLQDLMCPVCSPCDHSNSVTQITPPYLQSVAADRTGAPRLDLPGQTLCFLFWFQSLQDLEKQEKAGSELVILQEQKKF